MSVSSPPPPPSRFYVDPLKITGYLLDPYHVVGGSKAAFFIFWGFDRIRPAEFEAALREHTIVSVFHRSEVTSWGVRWIYEGPTLSPKGMTTPVRSVWQVDPGATIGKLVTAYPC